MKTIKPALMFGVAICMLAGLNNNSISAFETGANGNRPSAPETEAVVAQSMNRVAKAVLGFLDDEGLPHKMILGDISSLPKLKASGGTEIRRVLVIALEEAGIEMDDDAPTQLMGRFNLVEGRAHPDDDFDSLGMEVDLQILDDNGSTLAEPEIRVWGKQVLQIAGLNVDIPTKGTEKARQKEIIRQYKEPDTKIETNQIRTKNPFSMEILVSNGGRHDTREPYLDKKGRPFVDLHLREEYIVRLYNKADHEVAAMLVIDGVNVFINSKEEGVTPDSKFIIKPGTFIDVPGWFITKHNSKAFEISGFEGSVAEGAGEHISSSNIGTITATFQACWEAGGKRPADEPGGNPKGGKATKAGRDLEKEYAVVVRDFGVVRSTISVRYDR